MNTFSASDQIQTLVLLDESVTYRAGISVNVFSVGELPNPMRLGDIFRGTTLFVYCCCSSFASTRYCFSSSFFAFQLNQFCERYQLTAPSHKRNTWAMFSCLQHHQPSISSSSGSSSASSSASSSTSALFSSAAPASSSVVPYRVSHSLSRQPAASFTLPQADIVRIEQLRTFSKLLYDSDLS